MWPADSVSSMCSRLRCHVTPGHRQRSRSDRPAEFHRARLVRHHRVGSETNGPVVGIVGAAAGGVRGLRTGFVEPALARGWRVGVTLTPTAAVWLGALGEIEPMADLTGLPVRSTPRLPTDPKPHPTVDCYVVAPASANTLAKLAPGLADNQATTQVCEAL